MPNQNSFYVRSFLHCQRERFQEKVGFAVGLEAGHDSKGNVVSVQIPLCPESAFGKQWIESFDIHGRINFADLFLGELKAADEVLPSALGKSDNAVRAADLQTIAYARRER